MTRSFCLVATALIAAHGAAAAPAAVEGEWGALPLSERSTAYGYPYDFDSQESRHRPRLCGENSELSQFVVPAKAGTHAAPPQNGPWQQSHVAGDMGPRFRGDDKRSGFFATAADRTANVANVDGALP